MTDRITHRLRQIGRPRHPIKMCVQPVMQRLDDRPTAFLSNPVSMLGGMSADLCLDRVERRDTREHFRRKRRLRRRVELEEPASHMCPTKCQVDRLIGAIASQALEAVIAVDLQNTFEAGQVLGRPQVLAVLTIDIGNRWVGRTAPWTVIDRIAPQKPRLGAPAARIKHGQAGVVGKDLRRRQNRCDHQVVERCQPPARCANPIAQRGAVQCDALALKHLGLTIQRQRITEFADDDMGDQRFGRHAAIDRACRSLGDNNRLLAVSAGVTWPTRHPDPQLCRHDVKLLRAQFTDAMHLAAAARAGLMRDIDHHLVARQMRRQCTVVASRPRGARSRLGSLRRCGRIFRRLALRDGLFLILEAQLQLLNRQLFGPTAELMTRQACDQQPKLVVLGIQLAQHLLQRDRIVRQCVRVDLHTAVMNDAAASLPELFAAPCKLTGQFRSTSRHRRPPFAAVEQSHKLCGGQHDPAGRVG